MDVSEHPIDLTSKGPIKCPNTTVSSVHFYISILEEVTMTLSVKFGHRSSSNAATNLSEELRPQ